MSTFERALDRGDHATADPARAPRARPLDRYLVLGIGSGAYALAYSHSYPLRKQDQEVQVWRWPARFLHT